MARKLNTPQDALTQAAQKAIRLGVQVKPIKADSPTVTSTVAFRKALEDLGDEMTEFATKNKGNRQAINKQSTVYLNRLNPLLEQFEKDFTVPFQTATLNRSMAQGVTEGTNALKRLNIAVNNLRYMQGISVSDDEAWQKFWLAAMAVIDAAGTFVHYARNYLLKLPANHKPGSVPSSMNNKDQPDWYKGALNLLKYLHDVKPKVANRPGMTEMQYGGVFDEVERMWNKIVSQYQASPQRPTINEAAGNIRMLLRLWSPKTGGVANDMQPDARAGALFDLMTQDMTEWLHSLKKQDIPFGLS